jgi:hypothetical protein
MTDQSFCLLQSQKASYATFLHLVLTMKISLPQFTSPGRGFVKTFGKKRVVGLFDSLRYMSSNKSQDNKRHVVFIHHLHDTCPPTLDVRTHSHTHTHTHTHTPERGLGCRVGELHFSLIKERRWERGDTLILSDQSQMTLRREIIWRNLLKSLSRNW